MGKIIGLTYDIKSDWQVGNNEPIDANAEFDKPHTIDCIQKAFEKAGHKVKRIGNIHKLLSQLDSLKDDVDIVFNICEGRDGRNRESQVPLLLDLKGIPFVGADALTLGITLDKVVAKKMFMGEGIPTAKFFVAKKGDDLQELNTIGYPLIVKTRHEGSSKGISEASKVMNLSELQKQVDLINEQYKQTALVEEFIKGTEFTVAVLGNDNPQAMPVVQYGIEGNVQLGNKFYTYQLLKEESVEYICPAKIPLSLSKKLQEIAVKAYRCVDCVDFGRVDFRVDEKGNPYVLEINPLPSLDPKDVFALFAPAIGSNYDETINRILNFALERNGLIDSGLKVKQKKHKIGAK